MHKLDQKEAILLSCDMPWKWKALIKEKLEFGSIVDIELTRRYPEWWYNSQIADLAWHNTVSSHSCVIGDTAAVYLLYKLGTKFVK